jgi:hypothetical protein
MRLTRMPFLGTVFCVGVVLTGHSSVAESEVSAASTDLSGQVKDVCGRVIPGATVTFGSESGRALRVITDGDGRYVFRDIASTSDRWVLGVEAVGFETVRREEIRLNKGAPLELNIRLLRDLSLKETLTVSHADPNARYQKYSIVGTVTDLNGIPVSGATVTFRASGPSAGIPPVDRCSTDELGRYDVSQWLATPARWILAVEFQGLAPYVQSELGLQPDEPQVIKISLRPR